MDVSEPGPDVVDRWHGGLAACEQARADRFRFDADRTSFLGAHALARRLLQAATGIAAASLTFSVGPRGKPELSVHGPMPIRFNLSHTRGMVTVAVGLCHDLGVDVEALDRMLPDLDLAQRYFAASEVQQLRESPAADRARCFFRFWTLKEAYLKATGEGLLRPLDSFAFALDPTRLVRATGDSPADWHFSEWHPTSRHQISLAYRRAGSATPVVNQVLATQV
jgi:4'-phosphopantetheinyl transferase